MNETIRRAAALLRRSARRIADVCDRHAGWILLGLLGATAWIRLPAWGVHWVNPDEGIYWDIATTSAERAREMIRTNAHPPLFYWLLRGIRDAGGGVEAMRAVSLAAGLVLPALVFLIARRFAGPAAGVLAALLLVNARGPVELSLVMRPYALHFVLLALALVFLFRFLDHGRPRDAAGFGLAAIVAMLVHYGTFAVLAGLGGYVGWLALTRQVERSQLVTLVALLALLSGLAFWLYQTHISTDLMGSAMQAEARRGWLDPRFADGPLDALENYFALPSYLFRESVERVIPLLVPAAVILPPAARRRRPALLALAVLGVAMTLSLLALYPFGPGRHSTYLAVLMAPAAGAALVGLLRARQTVLALAGVVSLALALAGLAERHRNDELPLRRGDVLAAVEHLREASRPGDLVLMDYQTFNVLAPSFEDPPVPRLLSEAKTVRGFESERRAYAFIDDWMFQVDERGDDVGELLDQLAARQRGTSFDPTLRRIWLFQGGWGEKLASKLAERLPGGSAPCPERFERPRLVICRLDPRAYRDYVSAREAAADRDPA